MLNSRLQPRGRQQGVALVMVLVMASASLLILSGMLLFVNTTGRRADRSDELAGSEAAAEAATEKVIAHIQSDFHASGVGTVTNSLATYQALVPVGTEDSAWDGYTFVNPATAAANETYVSLLTPWQFGALNGRYGGVGWNATCRVVSNARLASGRVTGCVLQDLQLAAVPIFSFAYFYNLDLEMNPWHDWTVGGRLHSNGTNYFKPYAGVMVTFSNSTTACGKIEHDKHPDDPSAYSIGTLTHSEAAFYDGRAGSFSLPLGTNNSVVARALIESPPVGENASSVLGQLRFFNKADLIIEVHATSNLVTSGIYNARAVEVPPTIHTNFLSRFDFYDAREGRTVRSLVFNMHSFRSQYAALQTALGRPPLTVYVLDLRTLNPSLEFSGVKVRRATTLPAGGLTVATSSALYVAGNFNSTAPQRPACLAGDAVTLLSANWDLDHPDGGGSVGDRPASSTTYYACVLTGIVSTQPGAGSGGVQNALRLLEDWGGRTLTLRGSLAVMFESEVATETWQDTSGVVYEAPTRVYTFNSALLTEAGLPPACPVVYNTTRTQWKTLAAGEVQ